MNLVLGLMGSARLDGNTSDLLRVCLDAAAAAGARTDRIDLAAHRLAPIGDCQQCKEAGRCRHDDDLEPLVERLMAADAVIIATPVYFYTVSSAVKLFLDRLNCHYTMHSSYDAFRARSAGRGAGILCCQEEQDPAKAQHCVGALQMTFGFLRWQDLGHVVTCKGGLRGRALKEDAVAIAAAAELGRRAAAFRRATA